MLAQSSIQPSDMTENAPIFDETVFIRSVKKSWKKCQLLCSLCLGCRALVMVESKSASVKYTHHVSTLIAIEHTNGPKSGSNALCIVYESVDAVCPFFSPRTNKFTRAIPFNSSTYECVTISLPTPQLQTTLVSLLTGRSPRGCHYTVTVTRTPRVQAPLTTLVDKPDVARLHVYDTHICVLYAGGKSSPCRLEVVWPFDHIRHYGVMPIKVVERAARGMPKCAEPVRERHLVVEVGSVAGNAHEGRYYFTSNKNKEIQMMLHKASRKQLHTYLVRDPMCVPSTMPRTNLFAGEQRSIADITMSADQLTHSHPQRSRTPADGYDNHIATGSLKLPAKRHDRIIVDNPTTQWQLSDDVARSQLAARRKQHRHERLAVSDDEEHGDGEAGISSPQPSRTTSDFNPLACQCGHVTRLGMEHMTVLSGETCYSREATSPLHENPLEWYANMTRQHSRDASQATPVLDRQSSFYGDLPFNDATLTPDARSKCVKGVAKRQLQQQRNNSNGHMNNENYYENEQYVAIVVEKPRPVPPPLTASQLDRINADRRMQDYTYIPMMPHVKKPPHPLPVRPTPIKPMVNEMAYNDEYIRCAPPTSSSTWTVEPETPAPDDPAPSTILVTRHAHVQLPPVHENRLLTSPHEEEDLTRSRLRPARLHQQACSPSTSSPPSASTADMDDYIVRKVQPFAPMPSWHRRPIVRPTIIDQQPQTVTLPRRCTSQESDEAGEGGEKGRRRTWSVSAVIERLNSRASSTLSIKSPSTPSKEDAPSPKIGTRLRGTVMRKFSTLMGGDGKRASSRFTVMGVQSETTSLAAEIKVENQRSPSCPPNISTAREPNLPPMLDVSDLDPAEFGKVVTSDLQSSPDRLPIINLPSSSDDLPVETVVPEIQVEGRPARGVVARPHLPTILDQSACGSDVQHTGSSGSDYDTSPPQLMPRGVPQPQQQPHQQQPKRHSHDPTESLLQSDTTIEQLTAMMRQSSPYIQRQMQQPIQVDDDRNRGPMHAHPSAPNVTALQYTSSRASPIASTSRAPPTTAPVMRNTNSDASLKQFIFPPDNGNVNYCDLAMASLPASKKTSRTEMPAMSHAMSMAQTLNVPVSEPPDVGGTQYVQIDKYRTIGVERAHNEAQQRRVSSSHQHESAQKSRKNRLAAVAQPSLRFARRLINRQQSTDK